MKFPIHRLQTVTVAELVFWWKK